MNFLSLPKNSPQEGSKNPSMKGYWRTLLSCRYAILVYLFIQNLGLFAANPFSMSPGKNDGIQSFEEPSLENSAIISSSPIKRFKVDSTEIKDHSAPPVKKPKKEPKKEPFWKSWFNKKTPKPKLSEPPVSIKKEEKLVNPIPNKQLEIELIPPKQIPLSRPTPKNLAPLPTQVNQNLEYRLKPGDKIEISVWGEDMTRELMVRPDGKVSYILIDEVDVLGKTFKELKSAIETKLSKFIIEPKVSIIGKSFEGNFVSILGAVSKPGRMIVSNSDHVLDVLSKAGGLKFIEFGNNGKAGEVANLRNAYLSRNGSLVPVDFVQLLYEGNMSHNIPVQIGDFIYIPSSIEIPIYVTGELNLPTSLPFSGKPTLLEAISEGSGFNIRASKSNIKIVRGGMYKPEIISINYYDIISGKINNPRLEPGDIIYVPPTTLTRVERISTQIIPFLNSIIQTGGAKDTIQNW